MTVLRFIDGLVVDHDHCPRSIMARRHWRPAPGGGAVCACTPDPQPVAPDDWSYGYQQVTA